MDNIQQFYQYVNGQFLPFTPAENAARIEFTKRVEQHNVDCAWVSLRRTRNLLLTQSDWVITRCTEEALPVPASVVAYREALRTITVNLQNPEDVVWPEVPEIIRKGELFDPPPPTYPDLPPTEQLITEDNSVASETV